MDLGRATCIFYPFIPRFFQKAYLTFTSHRCSPGWGPGIDAICGLSLLLVFSKSFKFQFDLEPTDTFQRVLNNSQVLRGSRRFLLSERSTQLRYPLERDLASG